MSADDPPDMPPQAYLDRIRTRGGIGFIAHPDHEGTPLFHVKHYPWTDWSVTGYTGIGIWDFMTDWQNSLTGYLRAALSYVYPALFLRGPSPKTLARWDRLSQERRVVGIGELDNHDTLIADLEIQAIRIPLREGLPPDPDAYPHDRPSLRKQPVRHRHRFRRPEKRPRLCRPRPLPQFIRILPAPDGGGEKRNDGR